eukprot:114707_1
MVQTLRTFKHKLDTLNSKIQQKEEKIQHRRGGSNRIFDRLSFKNRNRKYHKSNNSKANASTTDVTIANNLEEPQKPENRKRSITPDPTRRKTHIYRHRSKSDVVSPPPPNMLPLSYKKQMMRMNMRNRSNSSKKKEKFG